MAMKYKGQASITAFVCGLALLICVVFPAILLIGVPILIGGIIALIIKAKKEKEEQELYSSTIKYMTDLDTKTESDFEIAVRALINRAIINDYKIDGLSGTLDKMFVKYYQSVDNIGIAIIRNDYGNHLIRNSVVVTNRLLTPKAREFCRNGRIIVINRDVITDMYRHLYRCSKDNSHK